MSEKIQTRYVKWGENEKESELFSEPKRGGSGRFWWNNETKKFEPGDPPPREVFGQAPSVIFDSMPKTYHDGVCREIESRQEWALADKESGKLTFGSIEEPRRYTAQGIAAEQRELARDRHQASVTALKAYKENPKEVSAKVKKRAEQQREMAEKAGLDTLIDEVI